MGVYSLKSWDGEMHLLGGGLWINSLQFCVVKKGETAVGGSPLFTSSSCSLLSVYRLR